MRKFLVLTLTTLALLAHSAFAEEAEPAAGTLKYNMKQAGSIFKLIGATINDAGKNAENAQNAGDMAGYFKLAYTQTPEYVQGLPADAQPEAMKGYQEMIQKCVDHSLALQQAFINNDNAAAAGIYKEMKSLKQDGHDRYDP